MNASVDGTRMDEHIYSRERTNGKANGQGNFEKGRRIVLQEPLIQKCVLSKNGRPTSNPS